MERTHYRKHLQQPIADEHPQGEPLPDTHPDLAFIDKHMSAQGTLQHTDVPWSDIEAKTLQILTCESKDIHLLTHLICALQYQMGNDGVILGLEILADFIDTYWTIAYPEKSAKYKGQLYKKIIQLIPIINEKHTRIPFTKAHISALENTLERLETLSKSHKLPPKDLKDLQTWITTPPKQHPAKKSDAPTNTPASSQGMGAIAINPDDLTLDNSTQKKLKDTSIKLAETLQVHPTARVLAVRMRRFAMWGHLTSLPPIKKDNETDLVPVVEDRIVEYEEQVQQNPTQTLWFNLENSLIASPYWLDGNHLSYQLAQALEQDDIALAIHQEILQFIRRFPEITEQYFKGGKPFAQDSTKQWLQQGQNTTHSASGGPLGGDWETTRQNALKLARESGLPAALTLINQGLNNTHEPRDQFYWRLLNADVLQAQQLDAMAQAQYQTLNQQLQDAKVTQWEPSLAHRLHQHTHSVESE